MCAETKKAVIVDTFNNYQMRTRYVKKCLEEIGYQTLVFVSNFSHLNKSYITKSDVEDTVMIDTIPYHKNLSFKRIKSHVTFSKTVYKHIDKIRPDLIYCILPPNSLAKYIAKFGKRNKCRIFFDIFDLWPESLPASSMLKKFLFPWKNLRDKYLKTAEKIFLECEYYKKFLPKKLQYQVLYLSKKRRDIELNPDFKTLRFLYLGSINSIIDIDGIVNLLVKIQKKKVVQLYIVGGGEKKDVLVKELSQAGIDMVDCGMIFDEIDKDKIFSQCHFGINMYKSGLCIGLTMKSLDYFNRGLPIITHNIYDTSKIVNEYNCGFELDGQDAVVVADRIAEITIDEWNEKRRGSIAAFNELFAPENIGEELGEILR